MNLKHLSDEVLLTETEMAVKLERDALTKVLYHLLEVDRRRLYASLKYPSLFEYAVDRLKYSRHEAYNRISAMRVLKELPEVEAKINTGSVSLTTLCLAKTFFNQEKKVENEYGKEEKLELINQLENKSARDAEKIVLSLSSTPHQLTERVKIVSENLTEYKFTANEELHQKILKLKGLLIHKYPGISMNELMTVLCDIALKELDPTEKAIARERKLAKRAKAKDTNSAAKSEQKIRTHGQQCEVTKAEKADGGHCRHRYKISRNPRAIPASIKREVWVRDRGQCTNCTSTHALQFDHVKPIAFDGESTTDNLRLLCRSCNQHSAIKNFGANQMSKYL